MLLRDSIYEAIRRAILACEIEPGQELREQILAERYHVSRSPVRDALLRLELEGLVTVLPRQGYLVNVISIPDVEAMFDLRLVVTPACAARAAGADDTAVQTLQRLRANPHNSSLNDEFIDYGRAFHLAIADICGNPRLAALEYDLVAQFQRLVRVGQRYLESSSVQQAISEHNAIIDAIEVHDAETASRLTYHHAETSHVRVIAALRKAAEMGDKQLAARPVQATTDPV